MALIRHRETARILLQADSGRSGDYETGIAHFFKFRISEEFAVDRSMWTAEEHRDILDVRWWLPEDLKASGETVGPPGLIDLLVELG